MFPVAPVFFSALPIGNEFFLTIWERRIQGGGSLLKKVENKIDKIEAENRRMEKLALVARAEASTFVTEASNNPWADEKWETKITPSIN